MKDFFEFTKRTEEASKKALTLAEKKFSEIDEITEYNQRKVLAAFINNRVDETDFNSTTGYGYNDKGREKLDRLTAEIFGAEDGLIRATTLTCGTHTIATALYGVLRPGDIMLSVTGVPYDTIHSVIGIDKSSKGHGSLADFGVKFEYIELTENDEIDYDAIEKRVGRGDIKMVYIQRSRGYSLRHSISIDEIEKIATLTHRVSPDTVVMTDNCYGEFVETSEPVEVGCDLMIGSMIKNVGGGIARTGGYIAGKKALIDLIAGRLTAPGIGMEVGSYAYGYQYFYQGLFMAPHVVTQALKASALFSRVLGARGYETLPKYSEKQNDIITSIKFKTKDELISFCQTIQTFSPIDSHVLPEPWDMPGYQHQVIMAAGAFVQGSSIELSADGPIRPPYAVYFQGGLTWYHAKLGILMSLQKLVDAGLVTL